MKIYLVGGAVRDRLLGLPVTERDWVVVGSTPEAMTTLGYKPVGKDFPVFLHPDTGEEYALARTERKSGRGYKGFQVHASPEVTLAEDLIRRDLTINAIAEDEAGTLIDPYGGQADLKAKKLRHVSEAFIDDPLRVLRLARFQARYYHLGFTIADDTQKLINAMVRGGELSELVSERVWAELEKAFTTQNPAEFFWVLRRSGALAVLFPELDALFGVPNPPLYHPEIDSGVHTLMVLTQAARLSDQPKIRLAALLHDLGKATTAIQTWPSHYAHGPRGKDIIRHFCNRYRVPTEYREFAEMVAQFHIVSHQSQELTLGKLIDLLSDLDAFRRRDRFEEFLLVAQADVRGRTGFEDNPYPQADYLRRAVALASEVEAKQFVALGYQGKDIAEQLRMARIKHLRKNLD